MNTGTIVTTVLLFCCTLTTTIFTFILFTIGVSVGINTIDWRVGKKPEFRLYQNSLYLTLTTCSSEAEVLTGAVSTCQAAPLHLNVSDLSSIEEFNQIGRKETQFEFLYLTG